MYQENENRYAEMIYRRVGNSGLKLSALSLGFWHNFGEVDRIDNQRAIMRRAFDSGITHFDLANNYGPPAGSAEINFGQIFKEDFKAYRDELVISSKAGFHMWEGPYGQGGSKKSIIASCNQSLKRMQLDYVDIFYHHCPDPETPLEETAHALDLLIRQGKALYIGISNYSPEQTKKIAEYFKAWQTPFISHQPQYNMFNRTIESELLTVLEQEGLGAIVFSPLAQGLLSNRYLNGIPKDSRAHRSDSPFLTEDQVESTLAKIKQLNDLAQNRDQSLAQMALAWNLRNPTVASVLVGASKVDQLNDNLKALANLEFSEAELNLINRILK
ncbi:MAG: aldo/keto reductase [Streptococcaceae bacterium]|nr:aldo/keto reductase [Streptococcaceae bacterium]